MRSLAGVSGLLAACYFITATSPAWAQGPAPTPTPIGPPPPVSIGVTPAPAQGSDTIYLKGGAVVRGTLSVAVPGAPITIQLPNGQTLTIQWNMVDHIDRASTLAPPAAAPPPQAPATVQGPPPAASIVVHVDTDSPSLVLQAQTPGGRWDGRGGWTTVCQGSCDQPVPLGVLYRISGDGVRSSRPFQIGGQPGGRAQLVATTASSGSFTTGIVLASVGGAAAVIGLSLTLLGLFVGAYCGFGTSCTGDAGLITGGLVTTGVGVVGIVVGIVLAAGNAHSKVDQVAFGDGGSIRFALGSPDKRWPQSQGRETTLDSTAGATVRVPVFGASF
ncbi:MAG TPA: hypothetical protein VLM85_08460 [Polyangiaceae bacterium]|nr:hypothetical protein [Polyangiaceae bacterium]